MGSEAKLHPHLEVRNSCKLGSFMLAVLLSLVRDLTPPSHDKKPLPSASHHHNCRPCTCGLQVLCRQWEDSSIPFSQTKCTYWGGFSIALNPQHVDMYIFILHLPVFNQYQLLSPSYHEALWILCIFNVRHCFFLDSLLHWCLTPCWAVVKTYTLVWVGVARGAPPPPVENRGTLEWTWGNLLLSGVCGVLLWIRNLPGEYWKDKWLAGFQMPYEEKICATLCTDNACLATTMEHCMYVRG